MIPPSLPLISIIRKVLTHPAFPLPTSPIRSVAAMAPRVPARTAVNLSALKMRIRATKNVAKIVSLHL